MGVLKCPTLREMIVLLVGTAVLSSLLTYQIGLTVFQNAPTHSKRRVVQALKVHRVFVGGAGRGYSTEIPRNTTSANTRQTDISDKDKREEMTVSKTRSYSRQMGTIHKQSSQIYHRLHKIEERLRYISSLPVVVISNPDENITNMVVQKIKVYNKDVRVVSLRHYDTDILKKNRYSLLVNSDSDRKIPNENDVGKYQKVNNIPSLQHVIRNRDFPCLVQKTLQFIEGGEMEQSNCSQYGDKDKRRMFSTSDSGGENSTLYDKRLTDLLMLGKPHSQNIVKVQDEPVIVRLSVFISSFLPVRLYIDRYCTLLNPRNKTAVHQMSDLEQYIPESQRQEFRNSWWRNLKEVILTLVLTAEHQAWYKERKANSSACSCPRCFQWLTVDVVVMAKRFQPIPIKVSEQRLTESSLDSMLQRTFTHRDVVPTATSFVNRLGANVALNAEDCRVGYRLCLTDQDLVYLMDTESERSTDHIVTHSFIKVFPSRDMGQFSHIVNKIRQLSLEEKRKSLATIPEPTVPTSPSKSQCRPTIDIFNMLETLETKTGSTYNVLDDTNSHQQAFRARKLEAETDSDTKNRLSIEEWNTDCNQENSSVKPFLKNITLSPDVVQLSPKFSHHTTEYKFDVSYDLIVLRITAIPLHCSCGIGVDGNLGKSRDTVNVTLGIGENVIHLHVLDADFGYSKTLNVYTLTITRYDRSQNPPIIVNSLQVCQLKQDCRMKFSPNEKCGLQSTRFSTWRYFEYSQSLLPHCHKQNFSGVWYVPCDTCSREDSCNWGLAQWRSTACRNGQISDTELQKCLQGKRLLFIGDSTNRGILHYILQRVNGTLTDWDKTHDLKIYTNVNNGHTRFSFAYYPQFWLPTNHRPLFDKAVYQIIKKTQPLENNHNTILMVGGVQWFNKYHVDVIKKALKRENLSNITLVSKGFGAGFHQHIDGIHYKSQEELLDLQSHETELSEYGERRGFQMIPTYNMTMSRYRDFLQGKCACHFHRVKRITSPSVSYHIEGDINAAYSELVINQICFREND